VRINLDTKKSRSDPHPRKNQDLTPGARRER
jgi:hypothetical protein